MRSSDEVLSEAAISAVLQVEFVSTMLFPEQAIWSHVGPSCAAALERCSQQVQTQPSRRSLRLAWKSQETFYLFTMQQEALEDSLLEELPAVEVSMVSYSASCEWSAAPAGFRRTSCCDCP